jgi:hypothetical protein
LNNVIDQLGIKGILVSLLQTLRYLNQQVHLYSKQEREDISFAQAYVNATWLAIANRDSIWQEDASSQIGQFVLRGRPLVATANK